MLYICGRNKNSCFMIDKYINPHTDFGFKRLFGSEFNKELLISFLNAMFHGEQKDLWKLRKRCLTRACQLKLLQT